MIRMLLTPREGLYYNQTINERRPNDIVIPTRLIPQVDLTAHNQMIHKYSFVYYEYVPSKWLCSLATIHHIFTTAQQPPVLNNYTIVQERTNQLNRQATRYCSQDFFAVNHYLFVNFLRRSLNFKISNNRFNTIRERIIVEGESENIPMFCAEFLSDLSEMLIRNTTRINNVDCDFEAVFKKAISQIVVNITKAGKNVSYNVTFSDSVTTKINFEYEYIGEDTLVSKRIHEHIKTVADKVHTIGFQHIMNAADRTLYLGSFLGNNHHGRGILRHFYPYELHKSQEIIGTYRNDIEFGQVVVSHFSRNRHITERYEGEYSEGKSAGYGIETVYDKRGRVKNYFQGNWYNGNRDSREGNRDRITAYVRYDLNTNERKWVFIGTYCKDTQSDGDAYMYDHGELKYHFKGTFENRKFDRGTIIKYFDDGITSVYIGAFNQNKRHDRNKKVMFYRPGPNKLLVGEIRGDWLNGELDGDGSVKLYDKMGRLIPNHLERMNFEDFKSCIDDLVWGCETRNLLYV
jgi:hypothetical protein